MRNAQWMVQVVGVDGFRIDAEMHMPQWVMNYLDRAVYRESPRTLLDGSQENPFSFGEVYSGDTGLLQSYIRKDINPNDPGRIGGNRDVLDFPLYFAMQTNLSGNGYQNDWRNVVGASIDASNNGSEGVSFVSNQDTGLPYLNNVAYAYTLTRPGNAVVYFNAHEFGTGRDFPKDGRGDALGGLYGNTITNLVNIRDTHPDGDYVQRDLEKELLVFERSDDLLVGLSNRLDSGFDSRTVHTNFAPGTPLIELTGNAGDPIVDPNHDLPPLVVVDSNGNASFRIPRNRNANGVEDDKGYVIYGPSGPQGTLSLAGVDHVIPPETPTPETNGTARLSSIDVITGSSFQVQLDTNQVNLLGSYRDHDADGDNALFKIDDGVDVTGQGFVSTTPGDVAYGFQQFTTTNSPGYYNADGNGHYAQSIDVSTLSPGMHYITVRAFRHRNAGEPPIFTDFRQAIRIDSPATVSPAVSARANRRLPGGDPVAPASPPLQGGLAAGGQAAAPPAAVGPVRPTATAAVPPSDTASGPIASAGVDLLVASALQFHQPPSAPAGLGLPSQAASESPRPRDLGVTFGTGPSHRADFTGPPAEPGDLAPTGIV
jgi:hypothetical protein